MYENQSPLMQRSPRDSHTCVLSGVLALHLLLFLWGVATVTVTDEETEALRRLFYCYCHKEALPHSPVGGANLVLLVSPRLSEWPGPQARGRQPRAPLPAVVSASRASCGDSGVWGSETSWLCGPRKSLALRLGVPITA